MQTESALVATKSDLLLGVWLPLEREREKKEKSHPMTYLLFVVLFGL